MYAMLNHMLIRMSLCRAHYDLTLAACDQFTKCSWTYAAPCKCIHS
jgi:hypothetical protein